MSTFRLLTLAALVSSAFSHPASAQEKFGAFMTCLLGQVTPATTSWLTPSPEDLAINPRPFAGIFEVPLTDVLAEEAKTYASGDALFQLRDFGNVLQHDVSQLRILPTGEQVQLLFIAQDGDGVASRTLWVLGTGPDSYTAFVIDNQPEPVGEGHPPLFSGYCRFQNSREDFNAALTALTGGNGS